MVNIEERYKEIVAQKVNNYIDKQIGADKVFMPTEQWNEMYQLLYNTFMAGVNASREAVITIQKEREND